MHARLSRRSLGLARLVIIAGFVHVTSVGCGEDPELCEEGSLDCACDERSECHDGLVCEDEICVASDGEGGADTAGSSGAPGTAGALGAADPQGVGGGADGASHGEAGASSDLPDPGASQGGTPGAGGSAELGGAPSSGNGGTGGAGGSGAGGSGGGGGGGQSGGSGGSGTIPFPGSCSGCYVEFGCFPEHLDCTSDPDCASCVSTGYSPSLCDAIPAFQALLECACASPCESLCSAVCD